jgi:hypothetical protein
LFWSLRETAMNQPADAWYIRYPDGTVRRARADAVHDRLAAGGIPPGSLVRRSPDEEWVALEDSREFGAPSRTKGVGVGARLDPEALPAIGVRGVFQKLLAALDATLTRRKLGIALLSGFLFGVVLAVPDGPWPDVPGLRASLWWLCGWAALLIGSSAAALLTRLTYFELLGLPPARLGETRGGVLALAFRLVLAQILVPLPLLLLRFGLAALPGWLLSPPEGQASSFLATLGATIALALGLVLDFFIWPLLCLTLLLGPILVVERCSVWKALVEWRRLLRQELGRALLYEALALSLGIAVVLPLVGPPLALTALPLDERLLPAVVLARRVLLALAAAPLAAYLVVANVFAYLNLRYETGGRGR